MARHLFRDSPYLYRAVVYVRFDNQDETKVETYGPYDSAITAQGVATRRAKYLRTLRHVVEAEGHAEVTPTAWTIVG